MTSLYWLQCGVCGGGMPSPNSIEGVHIEPPKGISHAHYMMYNKTKWGGI